MSKDLELTWENARAWQAAANEKKEIHDEPEWKWDCGFKLDFDGSLLRVSSRFYPPYKNLGNWWEGYVTILFLDDEILNKEFKHDTLEELKNDVEKFVDHYKSIVKSRIKP